jgi:Holliday junction resolvase - archaeal type
MSRQKAGLRKEHDLAKEIFETSDGKVIPLRAGWSGNSSPPLPDLLIPYKGSLRAVEVKTSGQKRMVVNSEDLEDVAHWGMKMNEVMTYPYLTVKFTRYEAQTYRLAKPWDVEESLKLMAKYQSDFDSNFTRGGNISFGHPTHYDCDVTSAQKSPGDGVAMLRDLREDEYADLNINSREPVSVYEVIKELPDYYDKLGS